MLVDGQDPDKLFVERDILYLKDATETEDGGRMVIVLPKQICRGLRRRALNLENGF